jgi:hypothetical protein
VHIVSGEKKQELSNILIDAHRNSKLTPDLTFDTAHFSGRYKERQFAQGKAYYEGLGVLRADKDGRDEATRKAVQKDPVSQCRLLYDYQLSNAKKNTLLYRLLTKYANRVCY